MTNDLLETPTSGAVVVGADGSDCSRVAIDWAAEQAALEQRPLALVHAERPPSPALTAGWMATMGVDTASLHEQIRQGMRSLLDEAAEAVLTAHPGLEVQRVARLGDPREVLLRLSEDAAVVVVGTRGHGPVRGLLLGSVSHAAVMRAHCPVVVVRESVSDPWRGVVVGVERLTTDRPALEFAYRVADRRNLPVTLVHCFWDAGLMTREMADIDDDEPGFDDQRAVLDEVVAEFGEAHPAVKTERVLAPGFVDSKLIELSAEAHLLVVGHRSKPWLGEVVYGSLAPRVTERAHSSVAVIAESKDDEQQQEE